MYKRQVIDYEELDKYRFFHWDVTKLVNKWYDGQNNGLMIKYNNENTSFAAGFYSSDYPTPEEGYPFIYINYRNTSGLEDYWTYHEQNVGRAGTGYVNDYTCLLYTSRCV